MKLEQVDIAGAEIWPNIADTLEGYFDLDRVAPNFAGFGTIATLGDTIWMMNADQAGRVGGWGKPLPSHP